MYSINILYQYLKIKSKRNRFIIQYQANCESNLYFLLVNNKSHEEIMFCNERITHIIKKKECYDNIFLICKVHQTKDISHKNGQTLISFHVINFVGTSTRLP